MAAADTETDTAIAHDVHVGGEHAAHPVGVTDYTYFKIFLLLFAFTAVEVLLYYKKLPAVNLNNAALGVLAVLKFVTVVAYFMHLKFDNRVLRRLFTGGLILAILVYIAYLLTLGVFVGHNPIHT